MSMIGKTLAHYYITGEIGKGGMGVVYQAKDKNLGRDVAIKVLPDIFALDSDRVARFEREAKLLASLNHPNIASIHGLEESDGTHFLVMELIEGDTLADRISKSPVPVEECLNLALQISEALESAHLHGVIHRDLKPANIKITPEGRVKVLDFGLAKTLTDDQQGMILSDSPTISEAATQQGTILGTAAYMSPEQAEGKPLDIRSDIFSLGTVLYETLTGQRAFQGESNISILGAVLRSTPTPIRKLRANVPVALERIVNRCLEKSRDERYASVGQAIQDLKTMQSQFAVRRMRLGTILRKPRFAIPALIVLAVLTLIIGWAWIQNSRVRWARGVALPEIYQLIEEERPVAALKLMQQAQPYLKDDPEFNNLQQTSTGRLTLTTDPTGADFYIRDYLNTDEEDAWMHIGRTPLESVVVPNSYVAFRITKPDFDTEEGASILVDGPPLILNTKLRAKGTSPPGMIWIPAQSAEMAGLVATEAVRDLGLEGFWIDRYEVTNRQFKEFVDSGAYQKKEYWEIHFVKEDRVIPWEDAMADFKDSTGRQGPFTWEFGTYPQDQADYPVNGVCWYEAAAYAKFAGKSLPTVHHWYAAATGIGPDSIILKTSNFSGKGLAPIGDYLGLGPYGSYDMAGSVKEWCWNPSGDDRYILGGGYNEPSYSFLLLDARNPLERTAVNGFRCAKYVGFPSEKLTGSVKMRVRDRRGDKAATDLVYEAYRNFHQYDRGDLNAKLESVDNTSSPYWSLEKVSFQAAYDNERITAYLYLPKNADPPYQTVLHFPGANAIGAEPGQLLSLSSYEFVIRSGRALMYPIYKGTYERTSGLSFMNFHTGSNKWREIAIDCAKDLGRSLDYLESRTDIDHENLAYYGFSMGASEGVRLMALEPRIKVGVLIAGGAYEKEWPAEVDPLNFAPRVRAPVLMANGRQDFVVPLEGSQKPLFQMLGTPEKDKLHFIVEGGHADPNREIQNLSLEWLDRYLGRVDTR